MHILSINDIFVENHNFFKNLTTNLKNEMRAQPIASNTAISSQNLYQNQYSPVRAKWNERADCMQQLVVTFALPWTDPARLVSRQVWVIVEFAKKKKKDDSSLRRNIPGVRS